MSTNLTEQTLVLLKPDALDRGIVGEIITRFERLGVKIVGIKLLVSEEDTAMKHYNEDLEKRKGKAIRDIMVKLITSGPIVALVLEGIDIIEVTRKMVGATEPKSAAPGTIRGDYAHMSYHYADVKGIGVFNLIHASTSPEEAVVEINLWFKPEELVRHTPAYTKMTLHE